MRMSYLESKEVERMRAFLNKLDLTENQKSYIRVMSEDRANCAYLFGAEEAEYAVREKVDEAVIRLTEETDLSPGDARWFVDTVIAEVLKR